MLIRRLVGLSLKISVSLFALFYLFQSVRWEDVWQEIKVADIFYLFVYFFLGFAGVFVSALKWLALTRPHYPSCSLSQLFALYMVGFFFNNFLPTSVGGDVVRAYELGRMSGKRTEAMASVFVERFSGYIALVVFALFAIAFDPLLRTDIRLAAPVALASLGVGMLSWIIFNPSWVRYFQHAKHANIIRKLALKIGMFQGAVYMYKRYPKALLLAGVHSILFYFVAALTIYTGCLTFHVDASFLNVAMVVPVILIIFMFPISLGGIGVQEWAFYFVLQIIGIPGTVGLSLGLLFRARSVLFGITGGLIYPLTIRNVRVPNIASPSGSL